MRDRIINLLSSDDIEMVNLGATLLVKLPRKDWTPILRSCQKEKWYFSIINNKITIKESQSGTLQSLVGGTVVYTYTVYYEEESRDFDEERERREQAKKLSELKQQIKTKQYERKEIKRKQHPYSRARANAFASRRS